MHHDVPWCTEYPPVYSWYPPDIPPNVLMLSPRCTHDIPLMYSWVFNINPKAFINLLPHMHHDIPWCTEYPHCTHDIPIVLMISPNVLMLSYDVLNIPRCTHDVPPMYSWYLPICTEHPLMYSPQCTHGIPQCTHGIPQCTERPPMNWTHIIQGENKKVRKQCYIT